MSRFINRQTFATTLITIVTSALFPLSTNAQNDPVEAKDDARVLDEVVVTARRREESLQDVPLAITALSQEELRNANIFGIEDLAASTPGLAFTNTRALGTPIIRGLAQTDGGAIQTNVGVFMDGIYINNRSGLEFGNMDIAQIEVAKGPQSALYGRDSFAGAINYVTRAPEIGETDAMIQFDLGTDDRGGIKGSTNIPLGDSAALRLFGGYSSFDGTIENVRGGQNVGGWDKRQSVGGSLLLNPTDRLALKLFLLRNDVEEDQPALVKQNPRQNNSGANYVNANGSFFTLFEGEIQERDTVSLDNRGRGNTGDLTLTYAKAEYAFDSSTLSGTLGYTESGYDGFFDNVADLDAVNRTLAGPVSAYFLTDTAGDSAEQTSFDLQLASNGTQSFDWLIGATYYDSSSSLQTASQGALLGQLDNLVEISDFNETLEQEIYAGFASATFSLTDTLRLGGEVRRTSETQMLDVLQNFILFDLILADTQDSVDFDYWSGRATLEYRPNDNNLFYGYVANGVKTGGINGGREGLDFEFFDPEENTTIEIGSKSTLLDGRLTLNTALFFIDWTDLQSTAPGNLTAASVVVNGTGASSVGIEIDATVNISDNLTWAVAGTLLDPTYDDGFIDGAFEEACLPQPRVAEGSFVSSVCTGEVGGNQIAKTSKTQFYTSLTHVSPSAFRGFDIVNRIDFSHEGARPTTSTNLAEIPANNIFNYRLTFLKDDLEFSLWVDNLFDEEWVASTLPISSIEINQASLCRFCSVREENVYPGNGRQIGVTALKRF